MGPDAKDDDTLSRALWTDCSLECSVAMLTSCYDAYNLPTEFSLCPTCCLGCPWSSFHSSKKPMMLNFRLKIVNVVVKGWIEFPT